MGCGRSQSVGKLSATEWMCRFWAAKDSFSRPGKTCLSILPPLICRALTLYLLLRGYRGVRSKTRPEGGGGGDMDVHWRLRRKLVGWVNVMGYCSERAGASEIVYLDEDCVDAE